MAMKKSSKDLGVIKKKSKGASLQAKKSKAGWFFIAPFLLGFLLIFAVS